MPKVFFDVGANLGQNSLGMGGDPEWIVYAFEPIPTLFEGLKKRTAQFDNYHVFPFAVAEVSGFTEFNVAGLGDWGTSSLLEYGKDINRTWWGRDDLKVTETIPVKVITLKDFVEEHGIEQIDFLHSDVQGVDLEVLMGLGDKLHIVKAGMLETARNHDVKLYENQTKVLQDVVLFLYQNGLVIDSLDPNDTRGHILHDGAWLHAANEINVIYRRA